MEIILEGIEVKKSAHLPAHLISSSKKIGSSLLFSIIAQGRIIGLLGLGFFQTGKSTTENSTIGLKGCEDTSNKEE